MNYNKATLIGVTFILSGSCMGAYQFMSKLGGTIIGLVLSYRGKLGEHRHNTYHGHDKIASLQDQ